MKNITQKTENKELTPYQLLLEKLDDFDFSREFQKRQTARAKELISQILMVTTGVSDVEGTGNEWGHANLMELLAMFAIQHINFSRADLAEDLQHHLFDWTQTYVRGFSTWKDKVFADRDLDENGVVIETAIEAESKPPAAAVLDLSNCLAEDLSQKLSDILKNPQTPERLHNAIADELADLCAGQVNESVNSPEMIARAIKGEDE